uniref:Serine protease n=1 Tax=Azospirillum sp. TaxID=34012 RepID=UPI0025426ADF|nr:Chain A, Serine protease [Azospirillum sp.]8SS1_B Chain B, Serine protease [Azospirillum sp.]
SNAERLAAWTRLPWEGLRYSYNRERRGTAARSCPQLEADVALKAETQPSEIPLERQLILEACREAERFGFLHELSIAIVEMERLNKRPEAEVEEIAKLWQ